MHITRQTANILTSRTGLWARCSWTSLLEFEKYLMRFLAETKRRVIPATKFKFFTSTWQFFMESRSLKKSLTSTGFEPVTSAIPERCSTNWVMKPHFGSEVNLMSSYLPWSELMWIIFEIIHISTAVVDESEEWSSQYEMFVSVFRQKWSTHLIHRGLT